MVLVDTSVLIDFLRDRTNQKTILLDDILAKRIPWGISDYVYQEILQGSKTEKEFDSLKEYFETIPLYSLRPGRASFESAAYLNMRCRRSGVTIRSSIDLLIAQTAIENDLALLHNDSDFDHMHSVITELRIFS